MNLSWVTDLLKDPEVMGTIAGGLHELGVGYNLDSVASGLTIGNAMAPFMNPTLGEGTPGKMNVPKEWEENVRNLTLGINPEGGTPYNFDIDSLMPIGMNVNQALKPQDWGAFTGIFDEW